MFLLDILSQTPAKIRAVACLAIAVGVLCTPIASTINQYIKSKEEIEKEKIRHKFNVEVNLG